MQPEKTQSLVRRVARRMTFQHGLHILLWTTTAALFLLAVAAGVAKAAGWSVRDLLPVGAALLATAALGSVIYTLWKRAGLLQAASLIDEKLGLEERVLSVISLGPEQQELPAAVILATEAEQAVSRVHPAEIVPLSLPRPLWVPLIPLCLAAVLWALTPQWKDNADALAGTEGTVVPKNLEELKKRVEKSARPLEAAVKELQQQVSGSATGKPLKELLGKLDRLTQDLLAPKGDDPQKLQKRLAELSEVEKRLRELQQAADVKRATANTLSLLARKAQQAANKGPLNRFQDALKRGDLKNASRALKELAEKIKNSSLPPKEKKKMMRQLRQLQRALQELRQLKAAQQRLAKSGLKGEALERALEAMRQELGDARWLDRLSQQLAQAGQSLDDKKLAQALEELAKTVDRLADDLQAGELADDLLQQIADFRARMACPQCKGAG